MLCAVYRSSKKPQTYLFIEKRDDFSKVPDALLQHFGKPEFVLLVNLATREKLAMADIEKVKTQLVEQGFYLQLPPEQENWLAEHKRAINYQQD